LTEQAKERVWNDLKQQQKVILLREQLLQKREKAQYVCKGFVLVQRLGNYNMQLVNLNLQKYKN